MPNPFYQIYEGAALLAGARPYFLNTTAETGFLPDFDSVPTEVWEQCELLYVCSPGNPTGEVIGTTTYEKLFTLADAYDFVIAADECYSEIYLDEANPPTGLLDAARLLGRTDMRRCIVFHSLSKRSNAPGLRSGFVAGDADIISQFLRYRTYHGCAMPLPTQHASIAAWNDEKHVVHNRELYREKFAAVLRILEPVMDVVAPPAGFYLWPETPIADTDFARELYARYNVTVLPGQFLSRDSSHQSGREPGHDNPGTNRIRLALVAELEDCVEAAGRIRNLLETL
jgi:N-succinyldiaminopimelate aminotransferase